MNNNTAKPIKNILKIPELLINRVYIHLDNNSIVKTRDGLYPLINAIATYNPTAYGMTLSEKKSDDIIIYSKRTQRIILHEVDNFIYHIGQRKAFESMAPYASLNQIRHIHNFLIGTENSLPAFTSIIMYVIFLLLPPKDSSIYICQNLLEQIHSVVYTYYLHYFEDELAKFFEDSFTLVKIAMENNDTNLVIADFPRIPREHPNRLDSCL